MPDISTQFGIGESSVYRIVERFGAKLRGWRTPKPAGAAAATKPTARRVSATAKFATTRQSTPTRAAGAGGSRFKVSFVAEVTVTAGSIRDAIRQAEALGATEVTSITRA